MPSQTFEAGLDSAKLALGSTAKLGEFGEAIGDILALCQVAGEGFDFAREFTQAHGAQLLAAAFERLAAHRLCVVLRLLVPAYGQTMP